MMPQRSRLVASSALIALVFSAAGAWAQTAPAASLREASPPQPAPSPEAAPQPARPGFVEELGKLFAGMSIIPLKRPNDANLDLPAGGSDTAPAERPTTQADQPVAGKNEGKRKGGLQDTGETLSRLAKPSSMISGRSVCPVAANGTPDCKLGADRLCQGKGYKEGNSLNTDSAETCSARVLIPGRQRKPGDCRTDTFVTSALCQ